MRKHRLAPWIIVVSLSVTSLANAGCCDDFWSCLATVATAGVSCQVQGLINTVKTLSDTVNALFNDLKGRSTDIINDAKVAVEQSTEDIKQARERALSELGYAAAAAHEVANPPVAAVTAAPKLAAARFSNSATAAAAPAAMSPAVANRVNVGVVTQPVAKPADSAALKQALQQADSYVQDLKAKANTLANDVSGAERRARDAVVRHIVVANRIATDIALEPLRLLGDSLLDLLKHPERLFDPSAQIDADLRRISSEIPALLDRIGKEVTEEAASLLAQAQGPSKQLQDQAAVANSVVSSMQQLAQSKTQNDLDALNRLLPATAPQKVTVMRGVTLPVGITGRHEMLAVAADRLQVAKLPLIAKHRATVSTIVTDWEKFKVQSKAAIQVDVATKQKVNNQVAQLFRGKSKVEAAKKRSELVEEAKRRFAQDPKTLEKVQRYLETQAL